MKTFLRTLLVMAILIPCGAFAQWSAPIGISPNAMNASMNENMGPCIATSHDAIHVIWSDRRANGNIIYYTRSVDTGHTWSTAVPITDTMGKASMPSIAVNGRNVHIVWWDSLNELTNFTSAGLSGNSSFYIHSTDGGNTWGTKICIDSSTVFWPGVAVSGATVLVGLDKGGFDSTIVYLTKSVNNGLTFGAEQQVSTRTGQGRSEDQSTATDGKYIHMAWNDNRTGTMEIFYRRSKDMGLTWDPEVDLTTPTYAYTAMVCLDSGHVDIPHGGTNNAWIKQSSDSGATWGSDKYVISNGDYPFMVRSGENLHLVHPGQDSIMYIHSGNGGATWDTKVLLSLTGTGFIVPFIALTCPVLHVVWPSSGKIYYTRNPTGNPSCSSISAGTANFLNSNLTVSVYPNPAENAATILFGEQGLHRVEIFDITGRRIFNFSCADKEYTFSCSNLSDGMYFIKSTNEYGSQTMKFIKQ